MRYISFFISPAVCGRGRSTTFVLFYRLGVRASGQAKEGYCTGHGKSVGVSQALDSGTLLSKGGGALADRPLCIPKSDYWVELIAGTPFCKGIRRDVPHSGSTGDEGVKKRG
jgi:hypothetical protein